MAQDTEPRWAFLTNHARTLICIARDPGARLREIGESIVTDLLAGGYITRIRDGRRNRYTINQDLPLPDPLARDQNVGDLLTALAKPTPG